LPSPPCTDGIQLPVAAPLLLEKERKHDSVMEGKVVQGRLVGGHHRRQQQHNIQLEAKVEATTTPTSCSSTRGGGDPVFLIASTIEFENLGRIWGYIPTVESVFFYFSLSELSICTWKISRLSPF